MLTPGSKPFYRVAKPLVFVACLAPALFLLAATFSLAGMSLGANPVEALLHALGLWGLRFLLLSLSVTPLRQLTGWNWLIRFRRMLGLYAFFYVLMHFLVYAILDQGLAMDAITEDMIKRPYITLGIVALVLLVPLAATSTKGMMRRLGRGWKKLHRLVYLIAILAVWHFYWQVKLDTLEATIYAATLAALLLFRWRSRVRKQKPVAGAIGR